MLVGSMSASFWEARVLRKEVCLSVGGSEPVAHWLGLSSWLDIFEGEDKELGRELVVRRVEACPLLSNEPP